MLTYFCICCALKSLRALTSNKTDVFTDASFQNLLQDFERISHETLQLKNIRFNLHLLFLLYYHAFSRETIFSLSYLFLYLCCLQRGLLFVCQQQALFG